MAGKKYQERLLSEVNKRDRRGKASVGGGFALEVSRLLEEDGNVGLKYRVSRDSGSEKETSSPCRKNFTGPRTGYLSTHLPFLILLIGDCDGPIMKKKDDILSKLNRC